MHTWRVFANPVTYADGNIMFGKIALKMILVDLKLTVCYCTYNVM